MSAASPSGEATFGHERLSSIATTSWRRSSRSQRLAYSSGELPPTEVQIGTPSSARRGRTESRNMSIPGFWSPIELSIPWSVSAIRTGRLPARGSGVTVFVTKASRPRATVGAASASRQPEALSSTQHGPFHTEAFELAADLDDAAVARAVAAGHRCLPGELSAVGERGD